ncbi:protein phosphatase 2c containing protein [Stylonychia lemnae]|uniref:protein-serine/threonine phosphatase n=1 Tax=Stylonychia lemnae TaxID=5949 RepID=A0A078AQL3_STYLE|nr:protein phosphatase 2c containing protein [Stylonychia lemnae]|eukprot:CDW84725.1 protein phosphatase 2c containing protein [Stylonychia lemnae]
MSLNQNDQHIQHKQQSSQQLDIKSTEIIQDPFPIQKYNSLQPVTKQAIDSQIRAQSPQLQTLQQQQKLKDKISPQTKIIPSQQLYTQGQGQSQTRNSIINNQSLTQQYLTNPKFVQPYSQSQINQIVPTAIGFNLQENQQFASNNKFLPRKKKSVVSNSNNKLAVTGLHQNNTQSLNQNFDLNSLNIVSNQNHTLPMMTPSANLGGQIQSLLSISPGKLEEVKTSKSVSNKAYMLGQSQNSLDESSKRSFNQNYLKQVQKMSNQKSVAEVGNLISRFGKNHVQNTEKENESRSYSQIQNSANSSSIQPNELFENIEPSPNLRNMIQSKLQVIQSTQAWVKQIILVQKQNHLEIKLDCQRVVQVGTIMNKTVLYYPIMNQQNILTKEMELLQPMVLIQIKVQSDLRVRKEKQMSGLNVHFSVYMMDMGEINVPNSSGIIFINSQISLIQLSKIIKDDNFPQNPLKAIRNGFREAEKLFLEFAEKQDQEVGDIDRSGSCAIVLLIIDEMCYVANVGDSRAIMSVDGGEKIYGLSIDHKPTEEAEMKRITTNGGKIYQNSSVIPTQNPAFKGQQQVIYGPHRVFPGRLSVSRTFGDIEAKFEKYEGNPKVVIAEPDITAFKINKNFDYILMGCDGIFDKIETKDCIHLIWQNIQNQNNQKTEETQNGEQENSQSMDVHKQCGLAVDSILKTSALRKACDNLTAVIIAFDNFESLINNYKSNEQNQDYVNEDTIEEIMLVPIPEQSDETMQINDIGSMSSPIKKNDVIYLHQSDPLNNSNQSDNDNSLFSEDMISNPKYVNNNKQAYAQFRLSNNNNNHNMLSEISEEDDISMLSERGGILSTGKKSKVNSKNPSQQLSKQKMAGLIYQQQQMPNQQISEFQLSQKQPLILSTHQIQKPQHEQQIEMIQRPSNQQDAPLQELETLKLNPLRQSFNHKTKTRLSDQIKTTNGQPYMHLTSSNITNNNNVVSFINTNLGDVPAQKVLTPNQTTNSKIINKKQVSRNSLRPTNSLKAQTQQVAGLLESLNINSQTLTQNIPSSNLYSNHTLTTIRPLSSSKKRASTSNGFNSTNNQKKDQRILLTGNQIQPINNITTVSSFQSQSKPIFESNRKNSSSGVTQNPSVQKLQRMHINTINNPTMQHTQQAYIAKLSGSQSQNSQQKTVVQSSRNQQMNKVKRWQSLNRINGHQYQTIQNTNSVLNANHNVLELKDSNSNLFDEDDDQISQE